MADPGSTSGSSHRPLPTAEADADIAAELAPSLQTSSPTYRLSYDDIEFLRSDPLRGVRLQLEYEKTELALLDARINSTVVVFGSARIPAPEDTASNNTDEALLGYYDEARRFGKLMSQLSQSEEGLECVIVTGGGPGIMEAANRGATDADAKSVGLNIVLPREQSPNPYATPELSFQFHYFALRKLHFLLRARALVVFPGGFGTLDELFGTLTLLQTRRIVDIPVLLFGQSFWNRIVDFEAMAELGVISESDLSLMQFVERAEDAVAIINSRRAATHG